jgi:hypothetical protein
MPSAIALAMHVEMSLVFTAVPPPTVAPVAGGDRVIDCLAEPALFSLRRATPKAGRCAHELNDI